MWICCRKLLRIGSSNLLAYYELCFFAFMRFLCVLHFTRYLWCHLQSGRFCLLETFKGGNSLSKSCAIKSKTSLNRPGNSHVFPLALRRCHRRLRSRPWCPNHDGRPPPLGRSSSTVGRVGRFDRRGGGKGRVGRGLVVDGFKVVETGF